MRFILILLFLTVIGLQYKLWLGDGSIPQWRSLQTKIKEQEQENQRLTQRNQAMEADISELKRGDQALEEQARYDLGMIKEGEVLYQVNEKPK